MKPFERGFKNFLEDHDSVIFRPFYGISESIDLTQMAYPPFYFHDFFTTLPTTKLPACRLLNES